MKQEDASLVNQERADLPPSTPIWDPDFWRAHTRLVSLCDHVFEVTSGLGQEVQRAAQLGSIRTIHFATLPAKSRRATSAEWKDVEERSQTIWAAFSDTQRKKFILTQVPAWLSYLLSALLLIVVSSILSAFLIRSNYWTNIPGNLLVPFLTFVISLGAIGAAASIGMNALSLQEDASFDISKGKFLWLRLLLGALFGALLTISWIFPVFQSFVSVLLADPPTKVDVSQEQIKQALLLIVPFVLGFSTSVVILILARIVEAVQTLFGKSPAAAPKTPAT